jgi:hypothetical protein
MTAAVDASGEACELGFRSAVAVRRELARLVPHAIPVFLAVGSRKTAWAGLADRETSVSILSAGESTSIADSAGRSRAALRCVDDLSDAGFLTDASSLRVASRQTEIRLAIAPRHAVEDLPSASATGYDYFGFGSGPRRSMPGSSGLAHAPGALQAASPIQCGPHGATLVTVGDDGEVQTEFVPIATVRYESIALQVSAALAIEDLAELMTVRLMALRPEAGEAAWGLRWTIETSGPLLDSLSNPAERATLVGLLPESAGGVAVDHRLQPVPHALWPADDDPFAAEFAATLSHYERGLSEPAERSTLAGVAADVPHRSRLARLAREADVDAVINRARRIGIQVSAAARDLDDG